MTKVSAKTPLGSVRSEFRTRTYNGLRSAAEDIRQKTRDPDYFYNDDEGTPWAYSHKNPPDAVPLSELLALTDSELLRLPNFGRESLYDWYRFVLKHNLAGLRPHATVLPTTATSKPRPLSPKEVKHKSTRQHAVSRALCRSGKFETGQGCCAAICMQQLGEARRNCQYVETVHGELAKSVIEAIHRDNRLYRI